MFENFLLWALQFCSPQVQAKSQPLLAQFLGREGATFVGGDLGGVASGGFGDIFASVATAAMPFVNGAGILAIVVSGILTVVAQDENRIAVTRTVVVMASIGIVLVNIAYRLMVGYTTAFNFDFGANPQAGANIISTEILGFINFAEVPVAVIAIITIISYGIKAVIDYGGEQGATSFRKAVLSVLTGILMITIKFLVAGSIVSGDPSGITVPAVRTLFTIVSFVGLIAVVVIVAGGIYLVVNLGDENRATKAKNIIISVIFGLVFMAAISGLLAILIDGIF